jgi:PhnB protein
MEFHGRRRLGAAIMGTPERSKEITLQVNAYLNFRGDAEAAMAFYQSVLGGELSMMRFSDIGMPDIPDAEADNIMHSQIDLDGRILLMGSDVPSHMTYAAGDNQFSVSISGGADEVDTLKGYFDALSAGGTVTAPWANAPWGDWFGMCKDSFGVSWLINASGQAAA